MNEQNSDLNELKSFVADLKNDRAATKEKEKREAWTKYTSLSLVVLAVMAAVATQWAGKYSSRTLVRLNDSTFHQSKASDQWSFFQAKSIKQHLYELNRDHILREVDSPEKAKALAAVSAKIAKYEKEKEETKATAEALEKQRDDARKEATISSEHGSGMGLATSIFQISIAMGSICLVMKKRPLWYLSMGFGAIALFEMIRVWMK